MLHQRSQKYQGYLLFKGANTIITRIITLIVNLGRKLRDFWKSSAHGQRMKKKKKGSSVFVFWTIKKRHADFSSFVAAASGRNESLLSTSAPAAWEEKPYLHCALKPIMQMYGYSALSCASVRLWRCSISSSSHGGAEDLPAYWLHG